MSLASPKKHISKRRLASDTHYEIKTAYPCHYSNSQQPKNVRGWRTASPSRYHRFPPFPSSSRCCERFSRWDQLHESGNGALQARMVSREHVYKRTFRIPQLGGVPPRVGVDVTHIHILSARLEGAWWGSYSFKGVSNQGHVSEVSSTAREWYKDSLSPWCLKHMEGWGIHGLALLPQRASST